jgi:hypothetical protein
MVPATFLEGFVVRFEDEVGCRVDSEVPYRRLFRLTRRWPQAITKQGGSHGMQYQVWCIGKVLCLREKMRVSFGE